MRKALNWIIALTGIGLIIFIIIATYGGYRYNWPWVGVSELRYQKTDQEEIQQAKTLWDWLSLLIIPFVLAIGAYFFRQAEKRTDEEIAERRRKQEQQIADARRQQEQEIANDNLRETALQTYLDRMSELLLANNLNSPATNTTAQSLARARTITTLNRLDPIRKGSLLLFIHESNLINNESPLINLVGADLEGAILMRAGLQEAYLQGADLKRANLEGANLWKAHLWDANLEGADLKQADLEGATLVRANLREANLYRANLREADLIEATLYRANLREADLGEANLGEANLREADLEGANLWKAHLWDANLEGANLKEADLIEADLEGANLEGANLKEADLEGATLGRASYNTTTQWPDGYTPPAEAINTDEQPDN